MKQSIIFLHLEVIEGGGNPSLANSRSPFGRTNSKEAGAIVNGDQYFYSKPVVIHATREPIFRSHGHLYKDIMLVLFNEQFQTNAVVKASDVIKNHQSTGLHFFSTSDAT